jgi:ribonucleoside-diphosphate reductase alpha chain
MAIAFSILKQTGECKLMEHLQLLEPEYDLFPHVARLATLPKGNLTRFKELQRLVMLDRYSARDESLKTLKVGDTVVCEVKYDPEYPTQGFGTVTNIKGSAITINVEFPKVVDGINLPIIKRHSSKVFKPLETYWEQICFRTATGIASVEKTDEKKAHWFKKFYWMLTELLSIPGGRILYGAGTGHDVTLFNCFVLSCMPDSRGGIADHRKTTMEIMARGGGVGTNGSTLRPKHALVKGVNGSSSGSVSWLDDLSKLTQLVEQGGSRRGAQMIGLGDWHPDLIAFVLCKVQNPHVLEKIINEVDDDLVVEIAESLLIRDENENPVGVRNKGFMTGANISVLVSHDLMKAVEADKDWTLRFPDIEALSKEQKDYYNTEWQNMGDVRKWEEKGLPVKTYHTLKAKTIWDLINICARYSAEPGIIYIDECNDKSNSWYYAPLVVTNPCGEQPLPPNAVCNLIAMNMAKMLNKQRTGIDWELLKEVTFVSQRFADNVIDHSFYFLPENEKMALSERRVGKGVMGLADLMIDLKLPYGSDEMLEVTDKLFEEIAVNSYLASTEIAEEKGSFPFFELDKYLQSGFIQTLPEHVKDAIKQKGIRNVCSLTVAPTGSTGTMVGVSTGLEPYYSFNYFRSGRLGKWIEVNTEIAQRYFDANPEAKSLPSWFVSANDLSPLKHVRVQGTIQRWIDSAISKTCNAPSNFTVEQNKELYMAAWKAGCKGVTVYVDKSRDSQVLSAEAVENNVDASLVVENDNILVTESYKEQKKVLQPIITAELMTEDTRSCQITFDTTGNMIKECH